MSNCTTHVVLDCFTQEQVKDINKAIGRLKLKKEPPEEAAAYAAKIGEFSQIPCLALMEL